MPGKVQTMNKPEVSARELVAKLAAKLGIDDFEVRDGGDRGEVEMSFRAYGDDRYFASRFDDDEDDDPEFIGRRTVIAAVKELLPACGYTPLSVRTCEKYWFDVTAEIDPAGRVA